MSTENEVNSIKESLRGLTTEELTKLPKEELDQVREYLGVVGRPYPMIHQSMGTDGRIEEQLGVLENPLSVYSEREYAEVAGMAYRDMPTPSMLRLFREGNLRREPQNPRKVEFMLGHPGAGKSFLANLHGKMRDKRGAILVDCGGRDLGELLYETILDYEDGKTVYDEIDSRLAKGKLNPASIKLLEKHLGEAFSKDGDKMAIDWTAISAAAGNEEAIANVDAAIDAVKRVAELEGLGNSGDASIGLTTVEGPIVRAWREGRPIILDEYNKAKPGTDDALQILWQVFNGEMQSHTIKGGGGKQFTFDRDKMPANFFVTLTGNLTVDGFSTRSLSASAYQRLQPQYIEAPTVQDLQHRICQKLTGLPVSTIYYANEQHWKENPDQFTEFLLGMRKRGLSQEQQANIPSWQFQMLNNWDRVLQSSEQLATFYDRWAQVVDPESKLHRDAELSAAGTEGVAALMEDNIDEAYRDEVGIGLRRMMEHMTQATQIKPDAISSEFSKGVSATEDFDSKPDTSAMVDEAIEKRFGSRLAKGILEDLNALSAGKTRLLEYMLRQAAQAGLFELELEEGKTTGDKLLSTLLNLDPELMKNIPENIEEIHTILCDYVRKTFADQDLSENNADLISPSKLEHALSQLTDKDIERLTERSSVIRIPNLDPASLTDEPLIGSVASDLPMGEKNTEFLTAVEKQVYEKIQAEEKGLENLHKITPESLVDAERLLVSFALPNVGGQNIQALWNDYSMDCAELSDEESAAAVAVNKSEATGMATQLIQCKAVDEKGKESVEYLYVVRDGNANRKEGRTLITGSTDLSQALVDALAKNHITYVNRTSPDAEKAVKAELDILLEKKSDIKGANMPIQRTLTHSLGQRISWDDHKNEQIFELPHQDLLHGDVSSPNITDEVRGQDTENLVALLTDKGQYLDKAKNYSRPYVVTSSPDLDKLKHTLKALSKATEKDKETKAAGAGK